MDRGVDDDGHQLIDSAVEALPAGWVDLEREGYRLSIGYATDGNFTGSVLPGYAYPAAWLHPAAASALRVAAELIARERLGFEVYDAYRPARATRAMVKYCQRRRLEHLLNGFISERSAHSRGVAIDLGLVHAVSGAPLPMGTEWDDFLPASAFGMAVGAERANRRLLREVMEAAGFQPYEREWWHFSLGLEPLPPMVDIPYSAPASGT